MHNNASGEKRWRASLIEAPERQAHNLLMFCSVITAQVDCIIELSDKDSYLVGFIYKGVTNLSHLRHTISHPSLHILIQ